MNPAGDEEFFEAPAVKQQPWGVARGEHLQECKERQTRLAIMTLYNCQLVAILNEGDLQECKERQARLAAMTLDNCQLVTHCRLARWRRFLYILFNSRESTILLLFPCTSSVFFVSVYVASRNQWFFSVLLFQLMTCFFTTVANLIQTLSVSRTPVQNITRSGVP